MQVVFTIKNVASCKCGKIRFLRDSFIMYVDMKNSLRIPEMTIGWNRVQSNALAVLSDVLSASKAC